MPDVTWLDCAAVWNKPDGGADGRTIGTGKLDRKLCQLLGIPEGTGLIARLNDKGDNPNRPDIRISLALDPADHDRLLAQLGEQTNANGSGRGWVDRASGGGDFDRAEQPASARADADPFNKDDDDPFAEA